MAKSNFEFKDVGCCEMHRQACVTVGDTEIFINDIGDDMYSVTVFKNGLLHERMKAMSKKDAYTMVNKLTS